MALGATNAPHLNVRDINNGALATVTFEFPDGRKMNCMHVVSLTASVEKDKESLHVLGMIQAGNKGVGTTHTGSMTVYDITTEFREELYKYEQTGEDMYGNMQVVSEDNTSRTGRQSIYLIGVNFDNMDLFNIDINAAAMQTELSFTFEDWRIDDKYTDLDGLFPSS